MARTTFVNPEMFDNPRGRRRGKRSRKARGRRKHRRARGRRSYRGRRSQRFAVSVRRRNAGITPFIQNPLILSNPPRRRRHKRKNPLALPSLMKMGESLISWGGGTALALTVNTLGTSKISNTWGRRGAQAAAAAIGGSVVGSKSAAMGGAFAGAMLYPLLQDLAADLLGIGVAAGTAAAHEADIDALAADLEDVLDEMGDDDDDDDDDGGYGDDDDDELDEW